MGISGNGSTVGFGYDALGRRVSRTANGSTTQFVHDSGRIVLELQSGNVTAVYTYGNALVARNGEVVLADGLGTTRATVDSTQAVTSTFTTEAFGNTVAQWGSSANPYRFAGAWGYRDDGDAGLLHVGARYYDPQVGRFISRDAVLSEHPYLYCEHEPVNKVDPSGFSPAEIAPGAAGGIAIADGPLPIGDIIAVGIVIGIIIIEARGKKGKERSRDTGLQDLPDEVIRERARDKSLPPDERARYRREEKARKERNKQKRSEILLPASHYLEYDNGDYRSTDGVSQLRLVA